MGTLSFSPGELIYPTFLNYFGNKTLTLDAEDEKAALIMKVPATGTLFKVGIQTWIVTTGGTLTVRIETVDTATGFPTGNLYDASGTGSVVIADADDYTTKYASINSTSGITVTKGDLIAVVFTAPASFSATISVGQNVGFGFPYWAGYASSAWSFSAYCPEGTLEIDTTMYCPVGGLPCCFITTENVAADHHPDHVGIAFTLPFTAVCSGTYIDMTTAPARTSNAILYDSDGATALETIVIDPEVWAGNGFTYVQFTSNRTFIRNTKYRLCLNAFTNNHIQLYEHVFVLDGSLNPMSAMVGGTNICKSTCDGTPVNNASWTDDTTVRPAMYLIIDQILEPLFRDPGIAGGCNA